MVLRKTHDASTQQLTEAKWRLQGPSPQADEGLAAHAWQLLMLGQIPIVFFFAIDWLPQSLRRAVAILALQLAAGVAAAVPVFLLRW